MSYIPAGEFVAGHEKNPKTISLDAFCIDRFEVTQDAFEKLMGVNPSFFRGPSLPVEKVTWNEAVEYCTRSGQRLPTEWEWEKAAKGNTITRYYWGNEIDDRYAWYKGNADKQTHPAGKKEPNAFGLYDMSGNVWEWTASDHENGGKAVRGGSWRNNPVSLRSAHRILSLPIHKFHYVGFRCAL